MAMAEQGFNANGFVADPVIFSAEQTIADIKKGNYNFSTFPITETGTIGSRLLGVVSDRETDFELSTTKLGELMKTELITAHAGITLAEAHLLLKEKKVSFLPILDAEENLVSLVCKKDILNHQHFPLIQFVLCLVLLFYLKHPTHKKLLFHILFYGIYNNYH